MTEPMNLTFSVPKKYREMHPSLRERIERMAKQKDRPKSWIVLHAILRYLDEEEKSSKPS